MASSQTTALVLGHSFVRRFHLHLLQNNFSNLGLSRAEINIKYKGVGGLKAIDLVDYFHYIQQVRPRILYLEIGSNDLCHRAVVTDDVTLYLLNFVTEVFKQCPTVTNVIIGQVIYRNLKARSQSSTRPDYAAQVDVFNALLKGVFKNDPRVKVWKHKGLLKEVSSSLLPDGVHLNKKGLTKFQHSLKRAIVTVAGSF